ANDPGVSLSITPFLKDMSVLEYQTHEHTVSTLMQHFTGDPPQSRVLDVACGSGLVAKKVKATLFVGVDASEGMLKEAKLTGLYQYFAVWEVCETARPGGLVCLSKEHYPCPEYSSYNKALERALTQMESEGQLARLTATKIRRFLVNTQTDEEELNKRGYIPGTVHLFRKSYF
uniref:Methyltransferase domain-containing protein n=1 Tax=Neogobius melanostomus TaxID=47308 RepID=A0A8C6TNM5_9GOBI